MERLGYSAPSTLAEAGRLLSETDGAIALAGGTDVVVGLQGGKIAPAHVVDLKKIPDLAAIRDEGNEVVIGALTTMTDISRSEVVKQELPALALAAGQMGCWQVRNLATLGGNLCNASPSADSCPPLILYGAVAQIDGPEGARELPLAEFITGPGSTALRRGELLAGVRVPKPEAGFMSAYVRRALRKSMDIPIVNVAVGATQIGGVVSNARIVMGAVAPTPIRAVQAEEALNGRPLDSDSLAQAAGLAADECRPITDVRASAEYRRAMIEVFVRRALEQIAGLEPEATAGGAK